jgi:hypothetical protein
MHCHCYLRKGIVYIPTQGQIHKGLYLDIEPVAAVPLSDTEAVHHAFAETIARGNPNVPLPKQSEIPSPLLPKYAGVKTWSAFARDSSTWAISDRDGIFRITGYRKDGRGWVPDSDTLQTFPPGTAADRVIDRMIAILEEAAANGSV